MDSSNKVAIIVAVIGALATIISACIGVNLRRENVVLVNDNTAMQDKISTLENRLSQLEQAQGSSTNNAGETAILPDSKSNETGTMSQSVAVHTLLGTKYVSGGSFRDFGAITDNCGNVHKHSINTKSGHGYNYFFINLDYQYTELSGILFQNRYYSESPENTTLIIYNYNDGRSLWEGEVNGNSDVIAFQIDVTGMQGIKIFIDNASTEDQPPAFFEAYLWK